MTNATWRLVVALAALLTVGATGFALGAGLASEPVSAPPAAPMAMPVTSPSTTPPAAGGEVQPSPPSVPTSPAAPAAGSQPAADRIEISISNFAFGPAEVSVAAGTTVVFVNEDDAVHNVLSEDGQLQSPDLAKGENYEVTLDQPGTIGYICNIHQFMRGTITVTS